MLLPSPIILYSSQFCGKMGLAASFLMGKGSPTTQMVNIITGSLYHSFIEKETSTFPDFHTALLDIFNTFNSALPGKHYDVPSRPEVQDIFIKWKETADEATRKKIFIDFIIQKVEANKPERLTLVTGLVTPPVSMAAKKAGERVPALKIIKAVPDVVFVPTITFLALISVKVSKNVFHRRMVRQDQQKTLNQQKSSVQQLPSKQTSLSKTLSKRQSTSDQ